MQHRNMIKSLTGAGITKIDEVWRGSFRASKGYAVLTWEASSDGTLSSLEASYVDSRWPRFRGDNFYPPSIIQAVNWLRNVDPRKNYAHEMLSELRDGQTDELERIDEVMRQQMAFVRESFYFTRDRYEEAHKIILQYGEVISKFYKLMTQQEAQDRRSK